MTCELLEELKAIGVEVTPQGENLAIRPASKVPLELKERYGRTRPKSWLSSEHVQPQNRPSPLSGDTIGSQAIVAFGCAV